MKATKLFFGHDSVGRPVEMAQGENGQWFARWYAYNGYGMAFTKWAKHDETPTQDEVANDYVSWGFSKLRRVTGPFRVRLPG